MVLVLVDSGWQTGTVEDKDDELVPGRGSAPRSPLASSSLSLSSKS